MSAPTKLPGTDRDNVADDSCSGDVSTRFSGTILTVRDCIRCMPMTDGDSIEWRLHLESQPERVYQTIATAAGRESFWAESAQAASGSIDFRFPNGTEHRSRIVTADPPDRFAVEYFGAIATFTLEPTDSGGTDLTLRHGGPDRAARGELAAGWVSVLLALKAAVDHGIDLRNHDSTRTWDAGYVDN